MEEPYPSPIWMSESLPGLSLAVECANAPYKFSNQLRSNCPFYWSSGILMASLTLSKLLLRLVSSSTSSQSFLIHPSEVIESPTLPSNYIDIILF